MKKQNNLCAYCTDASMIPGTCAGVIFPKNSEEVSKIIKSGSNIVARGGGSGLAGGCVPQNSLVVDLSKMTRILKLDIGRSIVEVEAGVILDDLNAKLEKYNLEFPVKPSSHEVCTIGGMIATNAVGNRAVKYGRTSEWVQELEIVNGNGEILKIGKPEMSDFSGMEGITGVITRAKLKLANRKRRSSSLLAYSGINEIVDSVSSLKLDKDVSSIEFLDKLSSSLLDLPEKYHLIVEYESDKGKFQGKEYNELMKKRDNVYPVLAKLGYTRIEDPKILISKFPEIANFLEEEKVPFFGHLGVGIIHPVFQQDEEDKIREMIKYVRKLHGQVSGEHGIGLRKKEFIEPNERKLILAVKKRYDPLCKINCNKIVDCYIERKEIVEEKKEEIKQEEEKQNGEADGVE